MAWFATLRLHTGILPALHPVDEFRAPTWLSDGPLFIYAGALLASAGLLVATGDSPARRRTAIALAPVLTLGALALHSVRFAADLALVGAPLLALCATVAAERLGARRPSFAQLLRSPLPAVATGALLIGFSVAPRVAAGSPLRQGLGIGLDTRELPLEAIAFANDNGLRDRMYNDFEIGS